jgi:hypothetical protein
MVSGNKPDLLPATCRSQRKIPVERIDLLSVVHRRHAGFLSAFLALNLPIKRTDCLPGVKRCPDS